MVLFGSITNPSMDVINEIGTAAGLGMDYAEICVEGPVSTPDYLVEKSAEIKRTLKRHGLFALGHLAWWAELGSTSEIVRRSWVDEVKRTIDVCGLIGMRQLTVHSHARGMYTDSGYFLKEVLDNYVESLKELSVYGGERGVRIVLENASEKREISRLEDFRYIVGRVKDIGVHVDIGHAFINGGMDSVRRFISTFRGRIEHFHMHDNHGFADEHLPVGVGLIDYAWVMKELRKIKYGSTITLEVFARDRNYVKFSADRLRSLLK